MANAHVVAAAENGLTVEIDATGNPFVDDLLEEPLCIANGQLELPAKPGLGIELRGELIESHRLEDPFKLPDGAYSDMVFGPAYYNPAPRYA